MPDCQVAAGRLNHHARGFALIMSLLAGPGSAAAAQDPVTMVIRVYYGDDVKMEMVDRSQPRVEAIFKRARIRVEWRDCRLSAPSGETCDTAPVPTEVVVRLLPGPPLSLHACGVSLLPSGATPYFISLFVECIRNAAEALHVAEDVVFAGTLAHEIGHVLMGPVHTADGLMQRRPRAIDWQRAAHGSLQFTEAESRRLHQAMRERLQSECCATRGRGIRGSDCVHRQSPSGHRP